MASQRKIKNNNTQNTEIIKTNQIYKLWKRSTQINKNLQKV